MFIAATNWADHQDAAVTAGRMTAVMGEVAAGGVVAGIDTACSVAESAAKT
jgi:hypothetical protein